MIGKEVAKEKKKVKRISKNTIVSLIFIFLILFVVIKVSVDRYLLNKTHVYTIARVANIKTTYKAIRVTYEFGYNHKTCSYTTYMDYKHRFKIGVDHLFIIKFQPSRPSNAKILHDIDIRQDIQLDTISQAGWDRIGYLN